MGVIKAFGTFSALTNRLWLQLITAVVAIVACTIPAIPHTTKAFYVLWAVMVVVAIIEALFYTIGTLLVCNDLQLYALATRACIRTALQPAMLMTGVQFVAIGGAASLISTHIGDVVAMGYLITALCINFALVRAIEFPVMAWDILSFDEKNAVAITLHFNAQQQ